MAMRQFSMLHRFVERTELKLWFWDHAMRDHQVQPWEPETPEKPPDGLVAPDDVDPGVVLDPDAHLDDINRGDAAG